MREKNNVFVIRLHFPSSLSGGGRGLALLLHDSPSGAASQQPGETLSPTQAVRAATLLPALFHSQDFDVCHRGGFVFSKHGAFHLPVWIPASLSPHVLPVTIKAKACARVFQAGLVSRALSLDTSQTHQVLRLLQARLSTCGREEAGDSHCQTVWATGPRGHPHDKSCLFFF